MTDLPPGWEWASIADLCSINPRQFDIPPGDDETISFVPMTAMEADTGRMDASRRVRFGDVRGKSYTPFQELDVLFAKITPCMENGKVGVARGLESGRALGSTEFFVLRSLGAVLPRYLALYLLQLTVRQNAERNMTGAVGQRRVPRTYIEALLLPVPPLAEQRRIMTALENHLAAVDRGFTSLQVARRKTGFFAITGLDEVFRTLAYARIVHLRDILREPLRNGYSGRVATNGRGVRVITLTAVTKNKFTENNSKLCETGGRDVSDLWLERGDILIERANTPELVGTAALYLGDSNWSIFPDLLIRIRVNGEVLPEFLDAALSTSRMREYFKSSAKGLSGTMPKIDQSAVENATFRLPSLDMQREVVDRVREIDRVAMKLNTDLELAQRKAEKLRALLLAEGFSGRLVPQDPDDEPASVLLERIKAEREAQPKSRQARRNTDPSQERML